MLVLYLSFHHPIIPNVPISQYLKVWIENFLVKNQIVVTKGEKEIILQYMLIQFIKR